MRLSEDRFYERYPCIIITAKGQPDVATRLFLKKIKTTMNIPVIGLVDSDPYGLKARPSPSPTPSPSPSLSSSPSPSPSCLLVDLECIYARVKEHEFR